MSEPRPLLGGRDVRELLARHALRPTKIRGQNFVVDPNTVRRIVRDAGVVAGDTVVEVGPGLGSLTLALLEAGAQVLAIEVDTGLAAALRDVVGPDAARPPAGEPGKGAMVGIHVGDALAVRYGDLLAVHGLADVAAVMVANLPYNVATPILLEALREGALAGYHLMVQKEVGERWVAHRGDAAFGAVSVKIALLADARMAGTVSRQAFHPVPNVDSVTVDVRPRPDVDPSALAGVLDLVDRGFAQRRKRLRNALAAGGPAPLEVEAWLDAAGIPTTARAEELEPADWLRLAAAA